MRTHRRTLGFLCLAAVVTPLAWAVQTHGGGTAASSAAVGRGVAHSSACARVANGTIGTIPGPNTWYTYNAETAIALMISDRNGDGMADVHVTVTTPEIGDSSMPDGLKATPPLYGVFVVDGSSGIVLENFIASAP